MFIRASNPLVEGSASTDDEERRAIRSGARRRHAVTAGAYAAALLLARVMKADASKATLCGFEGPPCLFAAAFGAPCPGCGLTRGFVAAVHGDWTLGAAAHPAAPLIVWLALAGALAHGAAAYRGHADGAIEAALRLGRAAFIAALLATAVVRASG